MPYKDSTKLVVEIKVDYQKQRLIKEVQHFTPYLPEGFQNIGNKCPLIT